MMADSQRQYDHNGFVTVGRNPITRAGILQYAGKEIPGWQELGLEADKVYNVFRPPNELSSTKTLDSLKLLPITLQHKVLVGEKKAETTSSGLENAERPEQNTQGVTGQNVEFDPSTDRLYSNLVFYGQEALKALTKGIKELSIGLLCDYKKESGSYNNVPYDLVQTNLRGNHLAIVDRGRAGHGVAVLDSAETINKSNKKLENDIMPLLNLTEDECKDEKTPAMDTEEDKGKPAMDTEEDKGKPAMDTEEDKGKPAMDTEEDKGKPAMDTEEENQYVTMNQLKEAMAEVVKTFASGGQAADYGTGMAKDEISDYVKDLWRAEKETELKKEALYRATKDTIGEYDFKGLSLDQATEHVGGKLGIAEKNRTITYIEGFMQALAKNRKPHNGLAMDSIVYKGGEKNNNKPAALGKFRYNN